MPEDEIKGVYKFQRVKEFSLEVGVFLDIPLTMIFPVSNYHEELEPNNAKNALSLMALWNAVASGDRYLEKGNLKTKFGIIL